MEHGYYEPATARVLGSDGRIENLDSYYVGPVHPWRVGVTSHLHQPVGKRRAVMATSTNTWKGNFTGKNGVYSLRDLRDSCIQEKVIRDIMAATQRALERSYASLGLGSPASFPISKRILIAPSLPLVEISCTSSGLLAAAHLCGLTAVVDFLTKDVIARDEFGTSILDYLLELGGYRVEL
jgi:hypothetical protein